MLCLIPFYLFIQFVNGHLPHLFTHFFIFEDLGKVERHVIRFEIELIEIGRVARIRLIDRPVYELQPDRVF